MSSITIPADLEAWARGEVAAGRAQSVDAFVAAVLRERRDGLAELRRLVDEGLQSGERAGWIEHDVARAQLDRWIAEDEVDSKKR